MTAASAFVLVVRILSVEGSEARVEGGLLDGLRPGDAGRVYYELSVGSATKRIVVGPAQVVAANELAARCAVPENARPGYLVRFELPAGRVAPGELLRLARRRLEGLAGGERDDALRPWVDHLIPPDAQLDEEVVRILRERRPGPAEGRRADPADRSTRQALAGATMIQVPGGRYLVGRALPAASFYNQHPRFETEIAPFLIDPAPVAWQAERPDPSWHEADSFCRTRGGALPTEFQWEAAMSAGLLQRGRLEWTSSWYGPYPGNRVPEPEYGERVRVIRGAADPAEFSLHRRLFAPPDTRDPRLGFRCASAAQ